MEAKVIVELRESEIWVGPFCERESAKSTVKAGGRGPGGGGLPPLPYFFSYCYAFAEIMNTSKMTQIERIVKKFFSSYILCTK